MRKLCGVCALVAYVTLLLHACIWAVQMLTHHILIAPTLVIVVFLAAVGLHALCALILMVKGLGEQNRASQGKKIKKYGKLNRSIFVRRITGLVVLVLALIHALTSLLSPFNALVFAEGARGVTLLVLFVLLVVALVIHLINSVEPLFIGLGVKPARGVVVLIQVLVSLILIFDFVVVLCFMGGLL